MESCTPLETAELLRERCDARIAGRLEKTGAQVSCSEGCSACCRQLVLISPLERLAIQDYLIHNPELAEKSASRSRWWLGETTKAVGSQLEALRAAEGYLDPLPGGELELAVWNLQLPCVFLDEGGRCRIYPVRPFSCREHLVITPPALCSLGLDDPAPARTRLEFRMVSAVVGEQCHGLPDRLELLADAALPPGQEEASGNSAHRDQVEKSIEVNEARAARAVMLVQLAARERAARVG